MKIYAILANSRSRAPILPQGAKPMTRKASKFIDWIDDQIMFGDLNNLELPPLEVYSGSIFDSMQIGSKHMAVSQKMAKIIYKYSANLEMIECIDLVGRKWYIIKPICWNDSRESIKEIPDIDFKNLHFVKNYTASIFFAPESFVLECKKSRLTGLQYILLDKI